MTLSSVKQRAQQLRDLISQYNYEYHVIVKPTVSDAIYDSVFGELKKIEAEYPELITPDSPTQRVGNKLLSGFKKVKHSSRMISLSDVFDRSEVEAWIKRTENLLPGNKHEFFADIKMDGLACALIYQDGLFVQAITRGDGFTGEDVTENVRTIKSVPLRLLKAAGFEKFLIGRTEIRGEIVMLKSDFAKLNAVRKVAGEPEFANPRNLAAGTIRQLDPSLVASRPLQFRAYDMLRQNFADIPTQEYIYEALLHLGVLVNKQARLLNSVSDILKFADKWHEKRHELPFNTDGLVISINSIELYEKLGIVGKFPRGAIAYKYPAEQATTIVRDIVISIGRTGAATPVAVFNPIVVAGTTVQHASLHNSDEIERLDVRLGDTVVIFKAGDIIPQVESVVTNLRPKNSEKFDFKKALREQYPELEFVRPTGEAVYRVKGTTSDLILKRAVAHFASRGALDIDTLGEKNVIALVDAGLVNDLADIFALTKQQVLGLDRFAEVSAIKLINAINIKKNPPLERFLYGLGIRHVGVQTAIDLVNRFGSISNLQNTGLDELQSVEGVGKVVAESIIAWFADLDNVDLLEKFNKLGVKPVFGKKTGKLDGISFVITGTLKTMSRDIAAERIRHLGGTFQTATAQDTNYLVVGENVGASKLKKAQQYGTKIIKESDFLELIS